MAKFYMVKSKDLGEIENAYQGAGLNDVDVQTKREQYGYNEILEKQVGPVVGVLKRM
jgi:hypothetical protein